MELLSAADWDMYKTAINNASETFNQDEVTWHRLATRLARHGEEPVVKYNTIQLLGLVYYGYYKTWPDESTKVSGEADDTSLVLILNKQYLKDLGYTNADDYFSYDPGYDYFTIKGIEYETKGDTDVAQAASDPMLIYVRLDRRQLSTGQDYHG